MDNGACIALAICAESTSITHGITLWGVEYKNGRAGAALLPEVYMGEDPAEGGALDLELGAGITVPVGVGCIFTDGAVELRNDYVNFNAAVGYKVQF